MSYEAVEHAVHALREGRRTEARRVLLRAPPHPHARDLLALRTALASIEALRVDAAGSSSADPHLDEALGWLTAFGAEDHFAECVAACARRYPESPRLLAMRGVVERLRREYDAAAALLGAAAAQVLPSCSESLPAAMPLAHVDFIADHAAQILAIPGDVSAIRRYMEFRDHIAQVAPDFIQFAGQPILPDVPLLHPDADVRARRVVVGEYFGIGDRLMLSRFYPAFAARHPSTTLMILCHPLLEALYQRSYPRATFPNLEFVPFQHRPGAHRVECVAHYRTSPLGLGAMLGDLSAATIAQMDCPPLRPDPVLVASYRDRINTLAEGRRTIGISWRDAHRTYLAYRDTLLVEWLPLLRRDDVCVVALDPFDDDGEAASVAERVGAQVLSRDACGIPPGIDETAALIEALDATVGIEKVFLNLAGAMQKEGHVLVSRVNDYRWGVGDTSPFYPTLRLHRRRADEPGWTSPLRSAIASLDGAVLPTSAHEP